MRGCLVACALSTVVLAVPALAIRGGAGLAPHAVQSLDSTSPTLYQDLRWRNVGPTRGGRVTAIAGVRSQPCTYYMGSTGGGVWKTENCGTDWNPTGEGQIATGSIGSIDVAESNPNIVWVGTGSAAIRSNVVIGRGVYKSVDAGRTWQFMGLKDAGVSGSERMKKHALNQLQRLGYEVTLNPAAATAQRRSLPRRKSSRQ